MPCIYLLLALWSGIAASEHKGDIKLFVTAAIVSERGLPVYQEIADYVEAKIGRKATIVHGASYTETDLMLSRGIVHAAFVCGLPYIHNLNGGGSIPCSPSQFLRYALGKFPMPRRATKIRRANIIPTPSSTKTRR